MATKYLLREDQIPRHLGAYDQYFAGKLEDFEYPREAVERSMANLPRVESVTS